MSNGASKDKLYSDSTVSYAAYETHQHNQLDEQTLSQQLSYWRNQLAGLPAMHGVPLDYQRPRHQNSATAVYARHVSTAIYHGLKEFCNERKVTLFTGLHAAFSALLSHYSGETDIVVGTHISNLNENASAGLIGPVSNTVILRMDLTGNPCFIDAIQRSKEVILAAHANRHVPFAQVIDALMPERSQNQNSPFQIALLLQDHPNNKPGSSGTPMTSIGQQQRLPTNDLTLTATKHADSLQLAWEYNTDLFSSETIDQLGKHFETLLDRLVHSPQTPLSEVDFLSAEERQKLLLEWNATTVAYPQEKCIHELFESQVQKTPDAIAIIFADQQLTYRQLNEQANQLAYYLINERHVKPDTLVGICVERAVEMAVGILGILKAGGAYLPMDPEYPSARLTYMLEDARLNTVLTQSHLRKTTPFSDAQAVCLDSSDIKRQLWRRSKDNPDIQSIGLTSDHLAYVIYTSGSTGKPKGVLIEHRNTQALLSWALNYYDKALLDSVLFSTSVCFDLHVFELFTPLSCGGLVVGVKSILEFPDVHPPRPITLINTVPSAIEALLAAGNISASLAAVNLAGEPLKVATVDALYDCGVGAVYDLYGPSEDTTYSTCALRTKHGHATIGKPLDNKSVYILNEARQLVPRGVAGELYIGGAGLARGYLNRPELTAERFIANPFHDNDAASSQRLYKTGDLVRWLPDGNLEFLGRIDHQVKIRGFRIELGEIENTLTTHKDVKDVVVTAKAIGSGDKTLVAYVATDSVKIDDASDTAVNARQALIEQLREHLRHSLPDYMVPAFFVLMARLPLTPNGKIDRKALPEVQAEMHQQKYMPPRNQMEVEICRICEEVLGVERIGIKDNFFMLGGDSLLALKLSSKAKLEGIEIRPQDIATANNIEELAIVAARNTSKQHSISDNITIDINDDSETFPIVDATFPILISQRWSFFPKVRAPSTAIEYLKLELGTDVDPRVVRKAVKTLLNHHRGLRQLFTKDGEVYSARISSQPLSTYLKYCDVANESDEDQQKITYEYIADTLRSFDFFNGPLVAFLHFVYGQKRNMLLIVINHVLIDGYSKKILEEDWWRAYLAHAYNNNDIKLHRSDAITKLAVNHHDYIERTGLAEELNFLKKFSTTSAAIIPFDLASEIDQPRSTEKFQRVVIPSAIIDEVKKILAHYELSWGDLFSCATAITIADMSANPHVYLGQVANCRNIPALTGDLDLSGTIGCIADIGDIFIDVPTDNSALEKCLLIKHQMSQIPNGGVAIKYLYHASRTSSSSFTDSLRLPVRNRMAFVNFLGVESTNDSLNRTEIVYSAAEYAPVVDNYKDEPRESLVELVGCIVNGRMEITLAYSSAQYTDETTRTLLEKLVRVMLTLPSDHHQKKKH